MACGCNGGCGTKTNNGVTPGCGCSDCAGKPVSSMVGGDQVSQRDALIAAAQRQQAERMLMNLSRWLNGGGCLKCR